MYKETPKSVIICEIFLRVLFIFLCGIVNGSLTLVMTVFFIPALMWYTFRRCLVVSQDHINSIKTKEDDSEESDDQEEEEEEEYSENLYSSEKG